MHRSLQHRRSIPPAVVVAAAGAVLVGALSSMTTSSVCCPPKSTCMAPMLSVCTKHFAEEVYVEQMGPALTMGYCNSRTGWCCTLTLTAVKLASSLTMQSVRHHLQPESMHSSTRTDCA